MSKQTLKTVSLASIFFLIGLVSLAWSHGGAAHVLGTVTEVTQEQLIVQTKEKKSVTIALTPTTQYKPVGKQTTGTTPQVGDRVVIEASKGSVNLSATVVRFSSVSVSQKK